VLQALAGIAGLLALAWLASEKRARFPWLVVASGLALQAVLALVFLKLPAARDLFLELNDAMSGLEKATQAGSAFVFGYLGGGPAPYAVTDPASSFILAFRALPLVLVISALSALLFHWGVLQVAVRGVSWVLERTLRIGGAVGLSTAANVFVGMVEAPLFIKPYLARVTRGELFVIMVGGMASIAGTVLFLYASVLGRVIQDPIAHLLLASVLSAPAAIVIAAIMVPLEGGATGARMEIGKPYESAMDAITRGTLDGAALLISIMAMLLVLVALVTLVNLGLGLLPAVDGAPLSAQRMLGWVLTPVAWLAGVPWSEAGAAGALLGTKTILNELVAYIDLAGLPPEALSPRSRLLMTYALCGFANFGSLGIMIGGLATMCPERRPEVVSLGFKSILAGTLATCLTAAVVGLVL